MRKYLISTILLLSSFSQSSACGYQPYGEDIRYCLFRPDYFSYADYYAFYYNANLWGFDYDMKSQNEAVYYEANILDWYHFTGKHVSIESIVQFNNELKITDINPDSKNEFLSYLYQNKKLEVIQYLIFAKRCEVINTLTDSNPWEREAVNLDLKNKEIFTALLKAYASEKNQSLKRKYAFQVVRAAFYLNDSKTIQSIFTQQFQNGPKDYLYYWSLYFECFFKNGASKMIDVANLMANCPEKTYASYYYFHEGFNLPLALTAAKSKEEIANVYAFASVQKVGKNLDYLKAIYANDPNSRILDFLLLREINKIEDWVYTPYYTNYLPSVEQLGYYWNDDLQSKINTITLRARSEKDRIYAQEVLTFLNSVDFSKVKNVALWKAAEIQLLFITKSYPDCMAKINQFEKQYPNQKIAIEIEKIKAICITANQEYGKAIIKDEIKPIILKYIKDNRFLFALGRELEFNGNLTEGVALFSLLENTYSEGYDGDDVEWRGNRLKTSGNFDYFYTYFDYLDFVYSADELQRIVSKLDTHLDSDFKKILYKKLLEDQDYLKDLLGTKYIRENRLTAALKTFRSLGAAYWMNNYNAWERDQYSEYYAFDQNPFYTLKHTEEFIEHKEKFIVTKLSVTEHLVKFLNLANDRKTKDRDYYYFLVANCYFNMSYEGNSWMMRRYKSSSGYYEGYENESYIDEREYRMKLKAMEYYQLASENSKTQQFDALCLRMIDFAKSNYPNDFEKLKAAYPDYYADLSNCYNLEAYFKARR
ncbi:hypothetical protein [Flavobacterium sp.]|uniref:hypothetical protein n=1 Tax=Flavobacterium sp. TaxID=239 RepID=UPI00286CFD3F|nr:hypothetical protein [Flavobacterium sp.]